jgi:hypothetical protein
MNVMGGQVVHLWKMRNGYTILLRNPHGKNKHGGPGWENNLEKNFKD